MKTPDPLTIPRPLLPVKERGCAQKLEGAGTGLRDGEDVSAEPVAEFARIQMDHAATP